ncbi:MAG: helix-turn-helix domain-containing protein [Christensenellales bacterium]
MTSLSLPRIGDAFGRDHSTIINSCDKITKQLENQPDMKGTIADLKRSFRKNNPSPPARFLSLRLIPACFDLLRRARQMKHAPIKRRLFSVKTAFILHNLSGNVENKKISKTRLTNSLSYGMLYHVKAISH